MSALADGVDALLEASIVGSFTRLGFLTRRRLDRWSPTEGLDLRGRVIVITGATSGLGLEAATTLARTGATIEVVARDAAKAAATCARIRAASGDTHVDHTVADLGDLDAVRRAADALRARHARVDVLVHNAGALDDVRHETPQGLEQTVATHVVGPFLLTTLLLDRLLAAPRARVLWVSSGGLYSEPLDPDRLELDAAHYDGTKAYARAKRAQVTLSAMWAERLRATGVVVHAMHPGWADTPGVARSLPTFRRVVGRLLRTPAEGADTLIWLASDDGVPLAGTGQFWLDRRPRALHLTAATRRSDTPEARARLWAWVVARSGADDPSEAPITRARST